MKSIAFDVPFTRHKHVEVDAARDNETDFSVRFSFTTKGDHPGLRFHVELGPLYFGVSVYDDRHWDWDKNTYCEYDNE